jgi:peptide/nickel transport system permease protein
MMAYIIRRLLYAIPILIGVNLITFVLFFTVNTPDDMARMHLGMKRVTLEAIEKWKQERHYDKPLIYNKSADGFAKLTDTIFAQKSLALFAFRFGSSDNGRDIGHDIRQRMWPSLAIAVPVLTMGMLLYISLALLLVFFRATYVDTWGVVLAVMMMSISSMFYIIGGQFLIGKYLHLVPISGFDPDDAWKFLILPVIIGVVGGIGGTTRFYRTLFLEEIHRDYVRSARARGLSEMRVMFV